MERLEDNQAQEQTRARSEDSDRVSGEAVDFM